MLQGTVPFKAGNIADLHKLILRGEFDFPVSTIQESAKDLIRSMLQLQPEKRIKIADILNHPWIKEEEMLAEELLNEDDVHDLKVGCTFFRQELMSGLIGNGHAIESGNINFINVENLYYKAALEEQQEEDGIMSQP